MQIIYQPASGAPVTVNGIFDAVYVLSQGNGEAGTETLGPAAFLLLADLPIDPELDDPILTIAGVAYRVTERLPAGLGAIMLALRRVT